MLDSITIRSQILFTKNRYILQKLLIGWFGSYMVSTATFNNILVILWRSVLLMEETRVPRENHRPAAYH